jgi:predicted DsbA family dithiol-disulfide isomerase
MDTQLLQIKPVTHSLELDLIADLACPWSFLGKRSLERALTNLYGAPVRTLRWHGLPSQSQERQPLAWRTHMLSRLPKGIDVEFAHRSLLESGRDLGIEFDFGRLQHVPDTREAHRLVTLSARENHQSEVVDAIFSAFFERGHDIGDHEVLMKVAADCGLEPSIQTAFANPAEGRDDVDAEEKRLRGLGVTGIPNLLINGRVLVPGPADVSTYVQALDQALFPEELEPQSKRLLH